jgi:imidazole glycerol-phosphate synthase subunit HisF
MLAKRIIPTLLVRGRTLVKGERFDSWRSIGHALQGAKVHARRGVDELCILDIAATAEGRGPDLDMVRELSEGCFIPITVGGGVRSLKDIDALLRAGADKVAICTGIWTSPGLLTDASRRFGAQAIVACVDVKDGWAMTHSGTQRGTTWAGQSNFTAKSVAAALGPMGAGEILLSSVDRDGTMAGYDLALIREVSQAVDIPVIASGGCSGYEDMLAAFQAGADACAAGALFAFTDATPRGAAQFLKTNGMEVRL